MKSQLLKFSIISYQFDRLDEEIFGEAKHLQSIINDSIFKLREETLKIAFGDLATPN